MVFPSFLYILLIYKYLYAIILFFRGLKILKLLYPVKLWIVFKFVFSNVLLINHLMSFLPFSSHIPALFRNFVKF